MQYGSGPRIKVVGVGGAGSHALHRLAKRGLREADLLAVDTDLQALNKNAGLVTLQIGVTLTRGLGAGADPTIGRFAALESITEISRALEGSDVIIVTAGLGGGTGTGAAPVVTSVAKQQAAVTIAVVTMPFSFEGEQRHTQAKQGLEALRARVDHIVMLPNDRLVTIFDRTTSLWAAFSSIDDVLLETIHARTAR